MEEISEYQKNILGLQLPTDPRWVDLTQISLQEILTDHAIQVIKSRTYKNDRRLINFPRFYSTSKSFFEGSSGKGLCGSVWYQ